MFGSFFSLHYSQKFEDELSDILVPPLYFTIETSKVLGRFIAKPGEMRELFKTQYL